MEMKINFPGGARVNAEFGPHTIITDQDGSAPSPFATFLASLGTCAGIYVLGFCKQRGLPTEGIQIMQRIRQNPLHRHGRQDRPRNPGSPHLPATLPRSAGALRQPVRRQKAHGKPA